MNYTEQMTEGKLNLSKHVVAQVAQQAALEVDGVTGFLPLPLTVKEHLLRAKNLPTTKININGGTACITMGLEVAFDIPVEKVAVKVQQKVKQSVQSMTGLTVSKINISIMGIGDCT